jgi:hypothetical protein
MNIVEVLQDGVWCSAHISDDGLYRLMLVRRWDESCHMLGVVMLNPSRAALRNDPTIRKVVAFAKAHGYGGIAVYNMASLRSPNPDNLLNPDIDVVGPDNLTYLRQCALLHENILVAWGSHKYAHPERTAVLHYLLAGLGSKIWCLGINKDGNPKHPLYLRNDTKMTRYAPTI